MYECGLDSTCSEGEFEDGEWLEPSVTIDTEKGDRVIFRDGKMIYEYYDRKVELHDKLRNWAVAKGKIRVVGHRT